MQDFNRVNGMINGHYHEAALKLGLSDIEMQILYVLCIEGNGCNQSLLYKTTGITRSTVNTVIKRYEQAEILYLTSGKGRNTCVFMTEKGEKLLKDTVQKIVDIENDIFANWEEEDCSVFLNLNEKYADDLKKRIDRMDVKENG